VKACGSLFPLPRPGRCEPWGSAVEWLVAGGAIERMSVPVGRGSESNRFDVSVDAQTCCPFAAFTSYVAQDAVPSLDVSNGRERDGTPIGVERACRDAAKVMPSRHDGGLPHLLRPPTTIHDC